VLTERSTGPIVQPGTSLHNGDQHQQVSGRDRGAMPHAGTVRDLNQEVGGYRPEDGGAYVSGMAGDRRTSIFLNQQRSQQTKYFFG
jgi:hypothetical protein